MTKTPAHVAILIPCYNEEAAIGTVVRDFRAALPNAAIYVYDNNSKDTTAARARAAGAIVRTETRQGKGNVVRRMFADIEADVYVLVDGDDTYEASAAPVLVSKLISEGYDIVSGRRIATGQAAYRAGHVLGNRLLTGLTAAMFRVELADLLTGYRIMSRRFVKSFPFTAEGFGIETELTVHAVRMLVPMVEIDTRYKERPAGSVSKLNTWRDGFRILGTILRLYRSEKPLRFFTAIGVFLAIVSIGLAIPIIVTFLERGVVPRLPTAVLSMGLMILAMLSVSSGLVLDTVTRGRREMKLLAYLVQPPLGNN